MDLGRFCHCSFILGGRLAMFLVFVVAARCIDSSSLKLCCVVVSESFHITYSCFCVAKGKSLILWSQVAQAHGAR